PLRGGVRNAGAGLKAHAALGHQRPRDRLVAMRPEDRQLSDAAMRKRSQERPDQTAAGDEKNVGLAERGGNGVTTVITDKGGVILCLAVTELFGRRDRLLHQAALAQYLDQLPHLASIELRFELLYHLVLGARAVEQRQQMGY